MEAKYRKLAHDKIRGVMDPNLKVSGGRTKGGLLLTIASASCKPLAAAAIIVDAGIVTNGMVTRFCWHHSPTRRSVRRSI